MNLGESTNSLPVASNTLVVKPEYQGDLTKQYGSRSIRMFIEPYLGYFKPSESNFAFNIKMSGRGNPQPSADAAIHSLFNRCHTRDGTNTHLLEEVLQYNALCAQTMQYTKTEASVNDRSMYQGLSESKAADGCLYWALAGQQNWTNSQITEPPVARNVQICTPIKTKLYSCPDYIPLEAFGGLRLEFLLDDYRRSLEYQTGSLGIGQAGAVPGYPCTIMANNPDLPLEGAEVAQQQFNFAVPGWAVGDGYEANKLYSLSSAAGVFGWLHVLTAGAIGSPLVAGAVNIAQVTQQTTGATGGPYNGVSATGGAGAGATFNITLGPNPPGEVTNIVIVSVGSGYSVGDVLTIVNTDIGGGGQDLKFTLAAANVGPASGGAITSAQMYCLGTTSDTVPAPLPRPGDKLTVGLPSGSTTPVAAEITFHSLVNQSGTGAVASSATEIEVPLWASTASSLITRFQTPADGGSATWVASPTNLATHFGDDTVASPTRNVAKAASADSGSGLCFPGCVMPFQVGDRLYMSLCDGSTEETVGVISGIELYENGCPRLLVRPDRVLQPSPANDTAYNPASVVAGARVWGQRAYHHKKGGFQFYVKDADRMNGYTMLPATANALPDSVVAAAESQVDFLIQDFEYQLKRVEVDPAVAKADMDACNSEKGLELDLETTACRLVNQTALEGPAQQLVSIPNITRALGVLSVPIPQETSALDKTNLRGVADNMTSYQYEIGGKLCPNREVNVAKASLANPLHGAQESMEKIKCLESFGHRVANLNRIPSFSVGRQFSRPGMTFNLMRAGDLQLKTQYDQLQTSAKLFVHYLMHIRSINCNKNGLRIAN